MKKLNFTLLAMVAMVAMLPFLQSCNSDIDQPTNGEYVTVRVIMGSFFYFEMDNGDKIYPGDLSRLGAKYSLIYEYGENKGKSKNNCRAAIYFTPMETKKEGYEYNAAIYSITDIATEDISYIHDEEEVELLGDLSVEIYNYNTYPVDAVIIGDYLHLGYTIKVKDYEKSTVTLVENTFATPSIEDCPEGYTYLELYHKNDDGDDRNNRGFYNYLTYRLRGLSPADTDQKGLCIKFTNHEDDKVEYILVDYKAPATGK